MEEFTQPMSLGTFHLQPRLFSNAQAEFAAISTDYLNGFVRLLDSIRRQRRFMLLTAEPGMGKTMLLRKLVQQVPDQVECVFCDIVCLDFGELLEFVCEQLQLPVSKPDLSHQLRALRNYLQTCVQEQIRIALIVDEAHNLDDDSLSNLMKLVQAGIRERPVLQIILSGTPALEQRLLQQPELQDLLPQLVRVQLQALDRAETETFIQQQLQLAGAPPLDALFPADVLDRIFHHSRGIPRTINELCGHLLQSQSPDQPLALDPATVDAVARKLAAQAPEPPETHTTAAILDTILRELDAEAGLAETVAGSLATEEPAPAAAELPVEKPRTPIVAVADTPPAAVTASAKPTAGPATGTAHADLSGPVVEDLIWELTQFIGPIARILVHKKLASVASIEELLNRLVEHIPTVAERTAFLKKALSIITTGQR